MAWWQEYLQAITNTYDDHLQDKPNSMNSRKWK